MKLLLLAVAMLLACSHPQRRAPELPDAVGRVLDAAYPGWQFAQLSAEVAQQVPDARQWVRGDFDGDSLGDYAIQLVHSATDTAGTVDSAQVIIAALARPGARPAWELVVVRAGGASDITYLGLAARGERIRDLEADLNGDSTYVLAQDAVHVFYAEKAGETCLWAQGASPSRFVCRASGD